MTTPSQSDLDYRLQQQAILAEFGIEALRSQDLDTLLQRATELCARGMRTRFAKALEYLPHDDMFLLRAGVGWREGLVGAARFGADLASPAGFALKTRNAVISNHLESEQRFRTPALMAEHGVKRAINVIISNGETDFGVLEVDSPEDGRFSEDDLPFMTGFASLIGVAIERQRAEHLLAEALEQQEMLTREMSHRVKNSLAIVASLLGLQAKGAEEPGLRSALLEARSRVDTIAQVHDQLWRTQKLGTIALSGFVSDLCAKLQDTSGGVTVHCHVPHDATIPSDIAIPLGLVINELVTNAVKYAYPDRKGEVRVRLEATGANHLHLSVADDGIGLPEGFDLETKARTSLGMRMVMSLARQLGGTIVAGPGPGGARFDLGIVLLSA